MIFIQEQQCFDNFTNNIIQASTMGKQPKSIKAQRAIRKKSSKLNEGMKKTMIMHGIKTSETVTDFLKNIRSLRRDRCVYYSRKHEILPFEARDSLQSYCQKTDASLFLFGSHSKKRPNNIILGRTFDGKILDMIELGISKLTKMQDINDSPDLSYHIRPFIIFQGDLWQTDDTIKKVRNLINDFFFENDKTSTMELNNLLKVVINFTVFDDKRIVMKVFECKTEGSNLLEDEGKISMEQLGPNVQFNVRRTSFADADLWRKATYVPKIKKKKQNKNVLYDGMGNKKGRVYLDRQNLKMVPSRRKVIVKEKKRTLTELKQKKEDQFGI